MMGQTLPLSAEARDQMIAEALAEARSILARRSSAFRKFQKRYFGDPRGFIVDCIDWDLSRSSPAEYQLEIAGLLTESRRVAVRSPHGAGKSALCAWLILWFTLTRDGTDWKIPTLASAWRQITEYLWPEVHKWSRNLRWGVIGRPEFNRDELMKLSLRLQTGSAFGMASDNPYLIEGAHADQILYLFDEAKAIPSPTWDSAEGAFASGDCYWIAVSTPGEPHGRFHKIHSRTAGYLDWSAYHITLDMAIKAGRISRTWADQRREQWGEDSALYQNRVEGNFASSAEDRVISLAMVEKAQELWYSVISNARNGELTSVGVDVGRGGDRSVIARRVDLDGISVITDIKESKRKDVMAITGIITGILKSNWKAEVIVDAIGIGAGVVDRLRELRREGVLKNRIKAFVANSSTSLKDRIGELGFSDSRSAAWWMLREMLEDGLVALPDNDLLTGDLTSPGWREMSGGRIKVESKQEIRKRLGRSTDYGDAVIQALWHDPSDVDFKSLNIKPPRPEDIDRKWSDIYG